MAGIEAEDRSRQVEGGPLAIDVRQADAEYKPFPTFEDWSKAVVDTERWNHYTSRLPEHGELTSDRLTRAQEVAKRAAAVDTGAIEGLYEVDRGFTFTVATQAAMWEAAVNEKGPEVRALIESQLEAYDYVLDLATQQTQIVEAWIRTLHEKMVAGQEFYVVQTEAGPQKQKLPKGRYKHLPNHVLRPDGEIHSYAPVDLTPAEMHRFVSALSSDAFVAAHPVLQASYAHYALVVIHPFADGNGRVARALASVFTYRSNSIPLLVLVDTRAEYISTLEAADRGTFQPFVDFVLERGVDAILLVQDCLRAAEAPRAPDALAAIKRLYTTRGGYTHQEVDAAGYSLFDALTVEVRQQAEGYVVEGQVHVAANPAAVGRDTYRVQGPSHRTPLSNGGRLLDINATSAAPAEASVGRQFSLEVPRDAEADDDMIIRNTATGEEAFTARVAECTPTLSAAVLMRLRIFVDRVLGDVLQDLSAQAAENVGRQGY